MGGRANVVKKAVAPANRIGSFRISNLNAAFNCKNIGCMYLNRFNLIKINNLNCDQLFVTNTYKFAKSKQESYSESKLSIKVQIENV